VVYNPSQVQVPDPFVYAAVPLIGGFLLWCLRQFIVSTGKQGIQGDTGPPGPQGAKGVDGMSVRDFKEFSRLLCTEMNGRYLLAKDARDEFAKLNLKLDQICVNCAYWKTRDREGEPGC
jgi:hypothetical protein